MAGNTAMIHGQKGWNNKLLYFFVQINNVIETVLQKLGKKHLESCGNTSAVMCGALMANRISDMTIKSHGGWKCQPEDYLFLYLNDKRNYKKFLKARSNLKPSQFPGNRVPQYYTPAMKDVFNIDCKFDFISDNDFLKGELKKNNSIMVCLKKPGHYIALLAYDDETKEFIFNDPWPGRKGLKNKGFNERIKAGALQKNMKNFSVVFYNKRG